MLILAIDPGSTESGFVLYDSDKMHVIEHGTIPNLAMITMLHLYRAGTLGVVPDLLAVEMVASYGMPVGAEVFDTVFAIGRFVEAFGGQRYRLVFRRDVKREICKNAGAKDGNVRQSLIDMWGGKDRAIGKKASPGPLYGMSGDDWQALGVAVTAAVQVEDREPAGAVA